MTFFLAGSQPTLPIYVYNQLRFGFTPTINALFTCIIVFSVVLLVLSIRFVGGSSKEGRSKALPLV